MTTDIFPDDWEALVERDLDTYGKEWEADQDDYDPSIPCCDFRDHAGNHPVCACPDHPASTLHPYGHAKEPRRR